MVDDNESEARPRSKSQLKRDMAELQELGERLVALPSQTLAKIDLPEWLRDAIKEAQRITAREGRRRQLQYVGRLMRDIDPAPIRAYLATLAAGHGREVQAFRALEGWRDRLIAEGDTALDDYLLAHPTADRTQLRQLVRKAQQERARNSPPAAARALFIYLRQIHDSAAPGATQDES